MPSFSSHCSDYYYYRLLIRKIMRQLFFFPTYGGTCISIMEQTDEL